MKRVYILSVICLLCFSAAQAIKPTTDITGRCGDPTENEEGSSIVYTINAQTMTLAFHLENYFDPGPASAGSEHWMPDYEDGDAPWAAYADEIRAVELGDIFNIGENAFYGMEKLRYLIIPDNIEQISVDAFAGCDNLTTLEMRRMSPPTVQSGSLDTNSDKGKYIRLILVLNEESKTLYERSSASQEPSVWLSDERVIATMQGGTDDLYWTVGKSDTLQSLKLNISKNGSAEYIVLADRESGVTYPWDELGGYVEDLVIDDNVSYIGKGVFDRLAGLRTIQFHHWNHPLDSFHVEAFAPGISPWKFAMGDPRDGAVIPPKVIGLTTDAVSRLRFRDSTVLYVPDSVITENGKEVKVIDKYCDAPFWKDAFNRITDRTVDTTLTSDNKITLSWLPLELARAYRLTIHKEGCDTCDVTIEIPAIGEKGLVDWSRMPASEAGSGGNTARRARKGDDSQGGMTLTISINPGSGDAHNEDVQAEVSGIEAGKDYTFVREVLKNAGVDTSLSKEGAFRIKELSTGIEEVTNEGQYGFKSEGVILYDLLGRPMGSSASSLPDGLYILIDGNTRTTILLRR